MIKKTTVYRLFMTLPVAAALFALSGCGGDDDNPVTGGGNGSPSITACFTANNTISYAMTVINAPSGDLAANKSTVGPMTYNGQTLTGQTIFYPSGTKTYTTTGYWSVANNGVTSIGVVNYDGTLTSDDTIYPQNMKSGQVVTNPSNNISTTFVGFETITLAGKTFSNTCHFKESDTAGDQVERWYAPGYLIIKQTNDTNNSTTQYNGNL